MASWHDDVFFGIHYDLHAKEEDTELGAALTEEHLRERLLRTRPDWIQCDCKGHPGWTSWPTKVGSTSPGVVRDALRTHRDVTRELGIRLGMHYSGIIDRRAGELHPEWLIVNGSGGRDDGGRMCTHSRYADDLMIPQMLELVETYDVDGFWVDGDNWGARPCWCAACAAEFSRRTGITSAPRTKEDPGWDEWIGYHRDLFVEYVRKYADAVHARKPGCAVCSNWMYTVRQPDPIAAPVDYLSGDYTFDWGAYRAAIEGRMLDGRRFSWDLMVWGFSKTIIDGVQEKLWQMKNPLHLKQEVSEVIALGGAIMVYAKSERNGLIAGWHNDVVAEVGEFCRERRDVCFGTDSASEAAVLHLASSFYRESDPLFLYGKAVQPLEGALHGLLENHISADILTEEWAMERLGDYRLLVVPEQPAVSPETAARIRSFAEAGGHVVMSGEYLSKTLPDLCGASFVKSRDSGDSIRFLPIAVDGKAVCFLGTWSAVEPAPGTEVLRCLLKSQEPDDPDPDWPVVTRRRLGEGTVTAVHGPLFRNYFQKHFPLVRRLIGELVDSLGITWTVRIDAGRQVELIQRKRGDTLFLNLLNRGADEYLGPNRVMIDTLRPAGEVGVTLTSTHAPAAVLRHPEGSPIPWRHEDGLLRFTVPEVPIHEVIEIRYR